MADHPILPAEATPSRAASPDALARRTFCKSLALAAGLFAARPAVADDAPAILTAPADAPAAAPAMAGTPEAPAAAAKVAPPAPTPATARSWYAYVGSRTTRERNARGDGITVYRIDPGAQQWTQVQVVNHLINPSFLTLDRTGRYLYTVHGDRSEVSALRINPQTGELTQISHETAKGKNPVHLAVDPTNRFVVVANHLSSSLAVLPIGEDGTLGKLVDLTTLSGDAGPHRVEQPYPKPHHVPFDRSGRFIIVPDKGVDRTFVFRIDAVTGKLSMVDGATAISREGAGPRHVDFHPSNRFVYIVNELDSSITACRFDDISGVLTPIQVISSLPDDFIGRRSRAAGIAVTPDGRFVYASNRGHDSIAGFSINQTTGRLTPAGWLASDGRTPRFFTVSPEGDKLYVANEDSDSIIAMAINPDTGALTSLGAVALTGSPVCIIFKAVEA